MEANREYKDSVFTALFADKKKLVELYNAIQGACYGPDTDVEINTLKDLLYRNRVNDISFELDGKYVVLMEHQSTINENMPVRMLVYAARLIERLLPGTSLYHRRRIPIPAPEFIVLYNGTDSFPLEKEMKLSHAYPAPPGANGMDLCVKIININYEMGNEVLSRCKPLEEYSHFISMVRSFQKQAFPLEEAIRRGMDYCIREGILKSFLETQGSEVRNMLLEEWNMDDALKVEREEALEEGLAKGLEKGRRDAILCFIGVLDADTISRRTGIPLDEVKKLERQALQKGASPTHS